ncbi:MAG: sterol desaturase family protein [Bacteroidetes bacterium]|nr:sterol desaturase family protein [Bacteroidota bacterium]
MVWWKHLLVFFFFFTLWEGVAWFTHKYVMHGFLWTLHKDHHTPKYSRFEMNDLFGLAFAFLSVYLIVSGSVELDWRFSAGLGIAGYGAAYFFVHDIFVHQRVPWFKRTQNPYLMALRKAHKIHHKSLDKEDGEAFGFLFVHAKYWPKKSTEPSMESSFKTSKSTL